MSENRESDFEKTCIRARQVGLGDFWTEIEGVPHDRSKWYVRQPLRLGPVVLEIIGAWRDCEGVDTTFFVRLGQSAVAGSENTELTGVQYPWDLAKDGLPGQQEPTGEAVALTEEQVKQYEFDAQEGLRHLLRDKEGYQD